MVTSTTKKLIAGSTILIVGALVSNFGAYLFNMLTGRFLGPERYGEFTTLMSLMAILSVGTGAITTVVMRYTSELDASGNAQGLRHLFYGFTKYTVIASLLVIALGLLLAGPINNFFTIPSRVSFALAVMTVAVSLLTLVSRGYLQGIQKFNQIAIVGIVEIIGRIGFGVLLIYLGFSLAGAIGGVALASLVAYLYTLWPVTKSWRRRPREARHAPRALDKKAVIKYFWSTLVSTALLAILLNLDILFTKHYFNSSDAGVYAALSTIGKIIFYATAPIVGVMFPLITEKQVKGSKHYRILFLTLILILLGSMLILGAYYIFPGTVIRLLYGSSYTKYFYLLPPIGFAFFLYALINTMTNYFLAIKNFWFIPVFALGVVTQITLTVAHHNSFEIVIKIMTGTYALLAVAFMLCYIFLKKKQLARYFRGEYR